MIMVIEMTLNPLMTVVKLLRDDELIPQSKLRCWSWANLGQGYFLLNAWGLN